jgi:hypothetical protein
VCLLISSPTIEPTHIVYSRSLCGATELSDDKLSHVVVQRHFDLSSFDDLWKFMHILGKHLGESGMQVFGHLVFFKPIESIILII